jgi:uncharacterized protein (TIGR03000 family)
MKSRILQGLALAGLALLLTAEPALAQRRGGGGARGYRGGRVYAGGYRGGYARGYYRGGYYGGWRGGYNRSGYAWNRGYSRPYYGWGGGYWGWGGYPAVALGAGLGYPAYAWGTPYYGSTYYSTYSPTYFYPGGGTIAGGTTYAANPPTTSQSFYGPRQDPNAAQIEVLVPDPNAKVLFDGTKTQQRGKDRLFVTPPLPTDKELSYTITATWMENGQSVKRERRVAVSPGAQVRVNMAEDTDENMPSNRTRPNPNSLQTPNRTDPNAQPPVNPILPDAKRTDPVPPS